MTILQINSTARSEGSYSTRLADRIVARLREADPEATLTLRNLTANPHPTLDEAALGALFTPAAQRNVEQAARVALDDALIAEIAAADVEGLLKGKKVYVALTRGGKYRNTPSDTQVPYLATVLGFLGMTDVHYVYAEGLAMGADAEREALATAYAEIEDAVAA